MKEQTLRRCKSCGWTGPVVEFPRQGSKECPSWRHVCKACYRKQVALCDMRRMERRRAEQGLEAGDVTRRPPEIDPRADKFRPRPDQFYSRRPPQ